MQEVSAGSAKQRDHFSLAIVLVLAVVTLGLYAQTLGDDFINFDDNFYVTDNPPVREGLTWHGFVWAWTSVYAGYWIPLTWLSHITDCFLFGLQPAGHHATNALLHTVDTIWLFLLLRRMTGAVWRSGLVAALFGWHPLHVESVAWVAERKDVLSAFFFIATIWAYVRYAEEIKNHGSKTKTFYILSLLLFACGLMSKPMVVTLPFVLLLLDYWPLERLDRNSRKASTSKNWARIRTMSLAADDPPSPSGRGRGEGESSNYKPSRGSWKRLVLEKWPFFALSLVDSVITYYAQQGLGALTPSLPMPLRIANALLSYGRYLGRMVWPMHLAVVYPFHAEFPPLELSLCVLVLGALTWLALKYYRQRYLATGWFWFLGTLVPVIGLVQSGQQASADRFTYLPSIGIFLMLVWGAADLIALWKIPVWQSALAAAVVLTACTALTTAQLSKWTDSGTLFGDAVKVTEGNYVAWSQLGAYWISQKDEQQAVQCFNKALSLTKTDDTVWYNLGVYHARHGRNEEALHCFTESLRLHPRPNTCCHIGLALVALNRAKEALPYFHQAIDLDPSYLPAHLSLAEALADDGQKADAAREYRRVMELDPSDSTQAKERLKALGVGN